MGLPKHMIQMELFTQMIQKTRVTIKFGSLTLYVKFFFRVFSFTFLKYGMYNCFLKDTPWLQSLQSRGGMEFIVHFYKVVVVQEWHTLR